MCIYFIGDVDWDGAVLQSSNIAAEDTDTHEKKPVLKRSVSILLASSSKRLQDFGVTSFTSTNVL